MMDRKEYRNNDLKLTQLTGDIKPFDLEIFPLGSCNRSGHSVEDGTYLGEQIEQNDKVTTFNSF